MFGRPSIPDAYRALTDNIRTQILREPESFIVSTPTDELVEYYFSNNHFEVVEIDPERTETVEPKREMRLVRAHERERGYHTEGDKEFEYETLTVKIPIIPNDDLNKIRQLDPSSVSMSWSPDHAIWGHDYIGFVLDIKGYGFKHDENKIANDVKFQKERIYEWLRFTTNDIERGNTALREAIRTAVEERKRQLGTDNDRFAAILQKVNIPLHKKQDEAVKRVQIDTKPLVKRARPTPAQPENYRIDRAKVLDIVEILENQGRQFERTPKTFQNSEEEDLRNIFLVNLNTVFQGKATGETFSAKGKTDIYLNIDKGNILVAECKIWGGQKLYASTVDQLMGYLTWRENYGIMITFAKNKDFSSVLSEAEISIRAHSSYQSGFHKVADTHFLSHHVLPSDSQKKVELHHLFYNLYWKK